MILGDLYACPDDACRVQLLRPRSSAKHDWGPPTCACGRDMNGAGQVLL